MQPELHDFSGMMVGPRLYQDDARAQEWQMRTEVPAPATPPKTPTTSPRFATPREDMQMKAEFEAFGSDEWDFDKFWHASISQLAYPKAAS